MCSNAFQKRNGTHRLDRSTLSILQIFYVYKLNNQILFRQQVDFFVYLITIMKYKGQWTLDLNYLIKNVGSNNNIIIKEMINIYSLNVHWLTDPHWSDGEWKSFFGNYDDSYIKNIRKASTIVSEIIMGSIGV